MTSTARLAAAQYDQMIESGALGKHDKVEPIEGRLSPKPPRSHRHIVAGRKGFAALHRIASAGWLAAKGAPVAASEWSRPAPSLNLIRVEILDYNARDATTRGVALVVETADSIIAIDREGKDASTRREASRSAESVIWLTNSLKSTPAPTQSRVIDRAETIGGAIP